jgi:hypothetical protein
MKISRDIGGRGVSGLGMNSYSFEVAGGTHSGLSQIETRPRRMFQRLNCRRVVSSITEFEGSELTWTNSMDTVLKSDGKWAL